MVLSKADLIRKDLQNCFFTCRDYLEGLLGVSLDPKAVLSWFQGLCGHLTKTINLIGGYLKEAQPPSQNAVVLYLTQLITSLSLLINVFVREEEVKIVLVEVRKCVVKQMNCCLESIEVALDSETKHEPSGSFIKWMDTALEKVVEISDAPNPQEVFAETRIIFEEVLSHAMSIAQVSLPEDSKIIRGGSQSVLSTLSSLEKEINNTTLNGAMVNLFIDACSDKLCLLEKKVNTSVLKLCLKTFSQFTAPLEKIRTFCFDPSNKPRLEEMDSLIADFDLHVDRIMQIGLFAVSCSSNFTCGVKIRSCLASLEALESELVPTLTAVLLENSPQNTTGAAVLLKHWIDQATSLQKLIYLIIDPFAFCQVVYDEAAEIVDNFSVEKNCLIDQEDVAPFIAILKVLQSFLERAQSDFKDTKLRSKFKDYKEVLEEVEKATEVLLGGNRDVENCRRVVKRCKILLTLLKRLWGCFVDDGVHKERLSGGVESGEPPANPFLDHIINRGKQILQERSVLYRTPIKNRGSPNKFALPLSKLLHLRKLSFMNSQRIEESLDLQITNILNEMTSLSTTFKRQH